MAYKSYAEAMTINGWTYKVHSLPSGIYTEMFKRMASQVHAMLSHHSRVHVVRFDLRQHEYTESNERMTTFNRRLHRWLKAEYNLTRVGYIWAREQDNSECQHYHCALILDGHKINHPSAILKKIREIWGCMDGAYWVPQNCYYNLDRYDMATTEDAVYRLSYLSKCHSKGGKPKQSKNYSTSRIKMKF